MQTIKETLNNSEMQSRYLETISSWKSQLTMSKLKTILLVCLIGFTSLLVRQTLQVQHSCNPMIHWSGELPSECMVAVENDFDSFDDFSSARTQILKNDFDSFDDFSSARTQILKNDFDSFDDFSSARTQILKISKQQSQITQNAFKSQPNQITYGPPVPDVEHLQHNTKTNLKTFPDPFDPLTFVEFVKENKDNALQIGVAAGVGVAVVGIFAGAPIAGIILLATGIGTGVSFLWQGVKSIF